MTDYKLHKDFNRLFLQKEQRELYGNGFKNFIYLGLILLITFLVLGFASGSMKYLKKKMDDPFIKWIAVEIPYVKADEIPRISKELTSQFVKDSFNIEEINGYFQYTMFFMDAGGSRQFQALGRTIRHDNRILERIGDRKNHVAGNVTYKENETGLIVTRDLLRELGYSQSPSHIHMSYPVGSGNYVPAPVPVIAVVEQLPGSSHFVTTPYFYNKRFYSQYKPFDVMDPEYARTLEFFVPGSRESAVETGKELMGILEENGEWETALLDLTIQDYDRSFLEGQLIRLVFDQYWATHKQTAPVAEKINNRFGSDGAVRVYSYNLSGNEPMREKYDYLSVYFTTLDRIREFQGFMESRHELKIDMSQVESKENYNFVSRLTLIISIFLISFAILSIVFFIINVLKSHIEKIRKNLGTFKAFGLSNRSLIRIYIFMALRFLLIACVIAFIVTYFLGNLGFIRMILSLFNTALEQHQNYFDLLNWVSLLVIPFIIIVNAIIVRFSLSGILSRTPGDLIYNRD